MRESSLLHSEAGCRNSLPKFFLFMNRNKSKLKIVQCNLVRWVMQIPFVLNSHLFWTPFYSELPFKPVLTSSDVDPSVKQVCFLHIILTGQVQIPSISRENASDRPSQPQVEFSHWKWKNLPPNTSLHKAVVSLWRQVENCISLHTEDRCFLSVKWARAWETIVSFVNRKQRAIVIVVLTFWVKFLSPSFMYLLHSC